MYVGAIVDALRKHELANTDFGEQLDKIIEYGTSNKMSYTDRLAFQTHLNSVLRNLYTRFPLKNTHLYLQCVPGTSVYTLTTDQSESGALGRYILDVTYLEEMGSFGEDVLTVSTITNNTSGEVIPLNEYNNLKTIKTRNSTTLWVPNYLTKESTVLKVMYQALPKEWAGLRREDL